MLKRKIGAILVSTIVSSFIIGCGGGGGGSSSSSGTTIGSNSTTTTSTATDVTVERGAVFKAVVTDANGNIATQKSGTNVYTFATTPVYPITATGGFIDVDGDGQISAGDVELTTVLSSYSTVVTPITTYLGDVTTKEGSAKLIKLKEIAGVTNDDDLLKKVPSTLSTDVIVLANALFNNISDGDNTNDDFVSDYDNSEFKTTLETFKKAVGTETNTKAVMKTLEEKVVSNLGLTKLSTDQALNAANETTSVKLLKIADLTKFVTYKNGASWYDINTVANGKVSYESYDYNKWNYIWTLQEKTNPYVTITTDAVNPYKLTYVDPDTKEEGTFTIISTKKVEGYTDLYVSKVEKKITQKAIGYNWYEWDWKNPNYRTAFKIMPITDINILEKNYITTNTVYNFEDKQVVLKSDGKVYLEKDNTKSIGTWLKNNDRLAITIGKKTENIKVIQKNGQYYNYIAEADVYDVGSIEYETIYTGSNLEDFVTKIKATISDITRSPVFTNLPVGPIEYKENSTSVVYKVTATDNSNVTYSITTGTGGEDIDSFNINPTTGEITFKTAPDYETKNLYSIVLGVTDESGNTATYHALEIKIVDVDENTPPIANAGNDKKIYYTESVTLNASNSSDDSVITSYVWKEGDIVLSNEKSFVKSDFTVGTHNITLTVTDDKNEISSDDVVITVFNDFSNILPMSEVGGSKSISSATYGSTTTVTLGSGSQLYFKITNNMDRSFRVNEFKITSYYNGTGTVRSFSTNSSLLSDGILEANEDLTLGYTLSTNQTANYWVGTYSLTDIKTGITFSNSFTWNGTIY